MEQPKESQSEERIEEKGSSRDLTEEELRSATFFPEPPKASDYKTPEEDINQARETAFNAYPKVEQRYAEERIYSKSNSNSSAQESPKENPDQPKTPEYAGDYDAADFYDRLGVRRNASPEEIAAAHREAVKRTHPDAGGSTEDFKNVQQAYEELINPFKREAYNAKNPRQPEPNFQEPGQKQQPETEESKQEAPEPEGKEFSQRFKEGVRRGAKAFTENYARKRKEKEAKAQEEAEREREKRKAEEEKIKKEAEEKAAKERAEKEAKEQEELDKKLKAGLEKGKEKLKKAWAREQAQREFTEEEPKGPKEEHGQNPWEKWSQSQKVSERYFGSTRLGAESKKYIKDSLQNEIQKVKEELALIWFEENKYKLEARGTPISGLSREATIRLAMDSATGGFLKEVSDYLKERENLYKPELLEIENAEALGAEFEKDIIPSHSQFLMLNHLEKLTDSLYFQIEKLGAAGGRENTDKAKALQKEIDNLFIARKELAEKATGKDLTQEALARAKVKMGEKTGYESKDDYVKAHLPRAENSAKVAKIKELQENAWNALSDKEKSAYKQNYSLFLAGLNKKSKKLGLAEDQFYGLLDSGIKAKDIKIKGLFARKVEFIDLDGKKHAFKKAEFLALAQSQEQKYRDSIAGQALENTERKWDEEEEGQIIKEMTLPLDRAVGGVEAAYRQLKENLIEEHSEQIRAKTAKEQASQNKKYGGQGKKGPDILRAFSDIVNNEGDFADLTGDFKKDKKILKDIFGDYGIDAGPQAFKSINASAYEKAIKQKGGLMSFFIAVMKKSFEQFNESFKNVG